jgi:hypothetical protein
MPRGSERRREMNAPLSSPQNSAPSQGKSDAKDRLRRLAADKREAKAELRQVLEGLAAKWDIGQKDITYAIDGYVDDMLSDLAYGVERDLEQQAEKEEPL